MRSAISVLPSVVSEGSSRSCLLASPLSVFSLLDDLMRFAGGLPPVKAPDSGAVFSSDASRDDGCN